MPILIVSRDQLPMTRPSLGVLQLLAGQFHHPSAFSSVTIFDKSFD